MRSRVAIVIGVLATGLVLASASQGTLRQNGSSQSKPSYSLPDRPGVSDFGLSFQNTRR